MHDGKRITVSGQYEKLIVEMENYCMNKRVCLFGILCVSACLWISVCDKTPQNVEINENGVAHEERV